MAFTNKQYGIGFGILAVIVLLIIFWNPLMRLLGFGETDNLRTTPCPEGQTKNEYGECKTFSVPKRVIVNPIVTPVRPIPEVIPTRG